MARKIFIDECGRKALGIVRVAPTVPSAAAAQPRALDASPQPVRDTCQRLGASGVESTPWAVAWIDPRAGRLASASAGSTP